MNSKDGYLREFGKFRLDAEKQVLWFEEKPVNLALKEIELLCALTENSGEVITKNELLAKIWADSFVEESNLSRHIYVLRKTFKKFGARNLIETVPRRGYRFAGEVRGVKNRNGEIVIERHALTRTLIEEIHDSEDALKSEERGEAETTNQLSRKIAELPRRFAAFAFTILFVALFGGFAFWHYQNTSAAVSASGIKSIAVLPFKTIDAKKENEHQGLGLTDILITRLSNIKEINVRPTSAVLNFDNQDVIAFGKKLNVDAILEGTIYRVGDRVRVTARLLKTSDLSPIWAGQFEKPLQDELRLQDEIALQLVDALALNLSGNEKNALTKCYTENNDAYQLYLKGRYEWNKRGWGVMEAERLFRNAIEKDPNFALAYVGLADATATSPDAVQSYSAVKKALELDPMLAEAYATLGFLKIFHEWQWQEAERAFKKSIELNPGYATAYHWYAQLLTIQGRHEEAKTAMRRALEINPLSHNFLADLGQIYYFNREYKEAEEYCRKALEVYPDFEFAHKYLFDIYVQTGEYDKAVEEILAADKSHTTFANQSAEYQKQIETQIDRLREIYREGGIKRFVENRTTDTQNGNPCYIYATRYAFLGEKEKALDCLGKAYEGRDFLSVFVKADPVFDGLRDEPRYREILRKMNL